jgi:hypothetical protein
MTTQGGAAVVTHHRHSLEVEDEGLLKDLVVIFVFFLGILYYLLFLLMPESYFAKQNNIQFK